MPREEHPLARGPAAARCMPRELVEDPGLARVLAAHDDDITSDEGGRSAPARSLRQVGQAPPSACSDVEAVDARRRRRAAAGHARLTARNKTHDVVAWIG